MNAKRRYWDAHLVFFEWLGVGILAYGTNANGDDAHLLGGFLVDLLVFMYP